MGKARGNSRSRTAAAEEAAAAAEAEARDEAEQADIQAAVLQAEPEATAADDSPLVSRHAHTGAHTHAAVECMHACIPRPSYAHRQLPVPPTTTSLSISHE